MRTRFRRRAGRLFTAGFLGTLALLAGCAGVTPPPVAVPEVPARAAPAKPDLTLPPAPSRTDDQVWAEANRRADAMRPAVEAEIASLTPAALPERVPPPSPNAPLRGAAAETRVPAAPVVEAPPPAERLGGAAAKAPAVVAAAGTKSGKPAARPAVPSVQVSQRFTTENGLPSGRITALYVDDEDAWVGTADAGIARFNFREGNWIVTKVEDGLLSNRITDVVKYKGRMFVATQDGLSVWDGVSWLTQETEGKVKLINALFKVQDGLLWVAARNMFGGLLTYDGEKWKDRSTIRPGTVLNNVSDFAFSGSNLWIGTTNRGVFRFDGKDWTSYTVAEGLASNFVYTLGVQGDACYVGGCCGLSAFEEGSWRIYDIAEGMPHSTVNAIAVDGGLVWLGSKKGLSVFDGFNFTNFYTDNGLTDDRITSLFVKGNELWVGTANGLNRVVKAY